MVFGGSCEVTNGSGAQQNPRVNLGIPLPNGEGLGVGERGPKGRASTLVSSTPTQPSPSRGRASRDASAVR